MGDAVIWNHKWKYQTVLKAPDYLHSLNCQPLSMSETVFSDVLKAALWWKKDNALIQLKFCTGYHGKFCIQCLTHHNKDWLLTAHQLWLLAKTSTLRFLPSTSLLLSNSSISPFLISSIYGLGTEGFPASEDNHGATEALFTGSFSVPCWAFRVLTLAI